MMTPNTTPLIVAENIQKFFPLPEGSGTFTVLQDVNLSIYPGEVVALLGRSGSGKSTLLRILAGLIPASAGRVLSSGKAIEGANPDVAMVFQSFALLPWATVQENVELGLKARGVPRAERTARALKAIDMVGLDGFESAYPKELSGGMQQRVGFARAFVMQPNVLFMDEPFSALDVLTAENLRGEIGMLWEQGNFPAKSVLIVTHNIEEAVLLADRVIVLGANPGHVRGEVVIDLPRPRERNAARFKTLVDYIYTVMTNPTAEVASPTSGVDAEKAHRFPPLPHVRAGGISGLLEMVVERGGKEDIPQLAHSLNLGADDLLPIIDAATLLGFAKVEAGDIIVTDVGHAFANADILSSKEIFRQQALLNAPLVKTIHQTLQEKESHEMRADFFLDILDEYYPDDEANRQFETAVDWGRYAELYEYDAAERWLSLSVVEKASN
ncbi:MAG: nitrate/sulfonate/bicarbonate ABC transporter ATP-binding protein [Anaerolineae bacterium]|nr:nitrate/sulfonate/bicarbonate ABC transporter ATP-binding protein [Anaerolineae bacterium]MDW8173721.1 nitrate/sulfonate/bicarbonate ABC transporter ATP-binding protein [Anaerolineae bacterium]